MNNSLKNLLFNFILQLSQLFFIDRLQILPIDEIRENKEIFKRVISAIQESHQDNGIFEIKDENIKIFFEFVIWIRNLKKLYHLDFEKYIDGFDTNFDGSQQIHPGSPRHYEGAPYWKISSGKGGTQRFPSE